MRRTKIICTIGPATWSGPRLGALIDAGMDIARLNFAHGGYDEHARIISELRAIAAERGRPIAILQDLAGPKLRIGSINPDPVTVAPGETITLTPESIEGSAERVSLNYADLASAVKPGQAILLADGAITLTVRELRGRDLFCEVVSGGAISGHAGIHAPGASLSLPAFTEKDRADLRFGLSQGVDLVALSFVRRAGDLEPVRAVFSECGITVPIIAKIEKSEALDEISSIITAADGIMVARGDLGIEVPLERVPRIQKQLISAANHAGKPVITATQMLQSMVSQPRPTRAEVSDVSTAILDGTDAVLLADETAAGRYPIDAVAQMVKIINETEQGIDYEERFWRRRPTTSRDLPHAISHAACAMASDLRATAILTPTWSGGTARRVSRYRPGAPIIAASPNPATVRRLILCWGVHPVLVEQFSTTDEMIARAKEAALSSGLARRGDMVIITAGVPVVGSSGTTNLIKAERL